MIPWRLWSNYTRNNRSNLIGNIIAVYQITLVNRTGNNKWVDKILELTIDDKTDGQASTLFSRVKNNKILNKMSLCLLAKYRCKVFVACVKIYTLKVSDTRATLWCNPLKHLF